MIGLTWGISEMDKSKTTPWSMPWAAGQEEGCGIH